MHWASSLLQSVPLHERRRSPHYPSFSVSTEKSLCVCLSLLTSSFQHQIVPDLVLYTEIAQKESPPNRIPSDPAEMNEERACAQENHHRVIREPNSTCFPNLRSHSGTETIMIDGLRSHLPVLKFMRTGATCWALGNGDRRPIFIISQYPDTKVTWEVRKLLPWAITSKRVLPFLQRTNGFQLIPAAPRNGPRCLCPCSQGLRSERAVFLPFHTMG